MIAIPNLPYDKTYGIQRGWKQTEANHFVPQIFYAIRSVFGLQSVFGHWKVVGQIYSSWMVLLEKLYISIYQMPEAKGLISLVNDMFVWQGSFDYDLHLLHKTFI